jgi:LysR family nitrogen assimilation transcriptional regulator
LRYFVKVAELGNMTKAAAALNVAQPALGLQIRQLEDGLGTPLLERHSRGVEMTPAGQLLYDRAIEILSLFEKAEADVRALKGSRQETLRLGITHSNMRLLGTELLVAARRDIPNVLLSVIEEPSTILRRELENGDIDMAFCYDISPSLECTPLLVEELVFVARADKFEARETITLEEALQYELVMASGRDPVRRLVEDCAREAGLDVKIGYEVQSLLGTRQVVMDGLSAAILPYGVLVQDVRDGILSSSRISDANLKRTLYLAQRPRRRTFTDEKRIMRLIRSVVKQLMIDLGALGELPPPSASPSPLLPE